MSKILLSGVPGTGKSTLADYLENNLGYFHLDMEQNDFAPRHDLYQNSEEFLGRLAHHEIIIISWGFGPFLDRSKIDYIRQHGYSIVWLDGNRVASFREFMKRENNDPVKEAVYYSQMEMIVVTSIVKSLSPIVVNPFSQSGEFREVKEIAEEVIRKAKTA